MPTKTFRSRLGVEIERQDWEDHLAYMRRNFRPGEHLAIVAPTGAGKTTYAVGLLGGRRYVLAFDPKGGDSTLAGSGFERVTRWDSHRILHKVRKNDDEGRPTRLIVGKVVKTHEDKDTHRSLMAKALHDSWEHGNWTCYVDELQLTCDRRMLNLGDVVEEFLIAARDKGLSVVTSFQRPANVPRAASDQASWFVVGRTRDVDVVKRLAEMAGRPYAEMRGAIRGLASVKHSWLIFSRNPYDPMFLTVPKPVTRKRVA